MIEKKVNRFLSQSVIVFSAVLIHCYTLVDGFWFWFGSATYTRLYPLLDKRLQPVRSCSPEADVPERLPGRVLGHDHVPHDQEHGEQSVEPVAGGG